jgi:hypothetical protein
MNFIFMANYECVACGNSKHLRSQGIWLECDKCGMNMHNCNTYPCPIHNRVYWALSTHSQHPEGSKDKLIADFNQYLVENKQPRLTPEEQADIRALPDEHAYWGRCEAREEARLNAMPLTDEELEFFAEEVGQ